MKAKPAKALFLALFCALLVSSCGWMPDVPGSGVETPSEAASQTVSQAQAPKYAVNPLTGVRDLEFDAENARPVAIMINNIKTAWSVQTGLGSADIIYETMVEGGITRLMAVYKDCSRAPEIGTIRSARYSYGELAFAHDAIYVSNGADQRYFVPFYKEIGLNWYNLGSKNGGYRVKNGKALEHTMYTTGERLNKGFDKYGLRRTIKPSAAGPMFDFNDPDSPTVPSGGACKSVTVVFSGRYKSGYTYDAKTGLYLKTQGGEPHSDYRTGEQLAVKNVFVLFADVSAFPDGYHMKTDLTGGEGYYVSQGGYMNIKWSKGDPASPIKITDAGGKPVKVNAGTSWISLTDTGNRSKCVIDSGLQSGSSSSGE